MTADTNKAERGLHEALARIEEARRTEAVELDLSELDLTSVPESAFWLKQLQRLALSSNPLRELPESLGQLSQLQNIDLSRTQLTELPGSLLQLTELQNLALWGNELATLSDSIGRLTKLYYLDLSQNQLTSLPESICNLSQLEVLFLSDNQLTALPESIGKLTNLRYLYVSGNELSRLPDSTVRLTGLQDLRLSGNQLTEVPEQVCKLTNLRSLSLRRNQLTGLPDKLRNLTLLEYLSLHGNDALGLPAEVLGAGPGVEGPPARPADILEYYFRARGGGRPLNEAKLILVGRGAAGKTSIVNRLVHDTFKEEKKTEGIKITGWNLKLHGNEDVRLNIWDFGGQEIMHATHQFFLTQRSLYLLVLNGREGAEDADADYWLKLIESFGGNSPVIVVLNKIKEHPFDVNRSALQQKYPFIREFIKTDCQSRIGIDELSKVIERETDRLEHLRDAFPATWFAVKDRLAGMRKNFLSFDEYRRECAKLGEIDSRAQENLATYLNSLGIALNYRDDPRLQDMHVLNPRWVTNGIYKILNSETLDKQKGEIHLRDLVTILNKKDYPVKMHGFLMDLMKKFELCFSFPDNETHFLIPELLDKQEAPQAVEFKPEGCLNFQYHYPVLPEGLLPRFIVRTHALSENKTRWRTGTIMEFEGCSALVKADPQDKKVFISVTGPSASRRRLLAVIRSDFERIHRDIRNLQPEEMVPVPMHLNVVVPYKKLQVMERRGVAKFAEVIDDDVVELDVEELLNGVDLERVRKIVSPPEERGLVPHLFFSYSHKDEGLRNELETHLKLLQRQGMIDTWYDNKIEAGEEWKQKIDENLERADIILLLVSADFIASDYCYEKEMTRALERHENREAHVIPVIIRDVNWSRAPFAKLQALPKGGKAVELWEHKDSAWRNVSEGIERAATLMRKKSGAPQANSWSERLTGAW